MENGFCYDCGTPTPPQVAQCPACGGLDVGRDRARVTRWPAAAEELLPWPWEPLRWPSPSVMLLSGAKGSGKSSIAALLRPRLYLTTEQTPAQAAATLQRVQGAAYTPPTVIPIRTLDDLGRALDGSPLRAGSVVVLDSITELGLDDAVLALRMLKARAELHGLRVVAIAQRVKSGSAAGRERLPHLVDVVGDIVADGAGLRRLGVVKNRHGGEFTSYFRLGGEGVTRPRFEAAYSVEGAPGAYELMPHPTKEAKWSDPFSRMKGLGGMATAARRAPAYASGWLLPEDVEQRRAFAEAHGLCWVDPREEVR